MKQKAGGFVYVQTNDADHNEVVVFARRSDGGLERLDAYLTGGKGSGEPHLPSQSSVLLADDRLFVTNAGSDDVSFFAASGDRLELLDRAGSGGSTPLSVAVHGHGVYVLNTGAEPNVAGFVLEADRLVAVEGRVRNAGTDPAQVAFSPDGRTLLVTDRADSIHAFAVDGDGRAQDKVSFESSGATPYGFDLRADGVLVVTEAAGAQAGKASASSYKLGEAPQLVPVSGAGGQHAQRGVLGRHRKGRPDRVRHQLRRRHDLDVRDWRRRQDRAARSSCGDDRRGHAGIRDEALSSDGEYLYALHADTGQVFGWRVGAGGELDPLGSANGLPLTAAGLAAS
jgi:6-phosphogluconolactonase